MTKHTDDTAVQTPQEASTDEGKAVTVLDADIPEQSRSLVHSPLDAMLVIMGDPKADADKLAKVYEIYEKWEERQARDAYVRAMSRFRSEAIEIVKTKKVGYDHKDGTGRTEYKYAPLNTILDAVVPQLSKRGLAHQWITEQGDQIKVTCIVRHQDGHSEQTSLSAAPDLSGKKNAIQAVGSTVTYLQRYTLLSLLGLAAGDQDDDAQGATVKPLSLEQITTLERLIKETKTDSAVFLEWACGEFREGMTVKDIPANKFDLCVAQLNRKKKAKADD